MDQKRPDDRQPPFTPGQLQSVLGTQEGKRLLQLLNRDGGAGELRLAADRQAAAAARSGDYETAKRIMQPLVQTPEASALLEQIDRRQENGHG